MADVTHASGGKHLKTMIYLKITLNIKNKMVLNKLIAGKHMEQRQFAGVITNVDGDSSSS